MMMLSTKNTILQLSDSSIPLEYWVGYSEGGYFRKTRLKYIGLQVQKRMIRQLSKLSSPNKPQDTANVPPTLPTSPSNKFRRTAKKTSEEQTNATQKTQSLISHDTQLDRAQHTFARTSRNDKRQDSRNVSQIEQPFVSKIITTGSKMRTQGDQPMQRQNFSRKIPMNSPLQNAHSPQNQSKSIKIVQSPRGKVSTISISNEQNEQKRQEQTKITLKRGAMLVFLLDRLVRQKKAATFKQLRENNRTKRIKYERQGSILAYAMAQFGRIYEERVKNQAFHRCKVITAKKSKENHGIDNQFYKINQQKIKQELPNILHLIYRTKLRNIFGKMNKNRLQKRQLSKCYPTLFDYYEKRKMKQAFELFVRSAKMRSQRKSVLLNEVSSSFIFCCRINIGRAFNKIRLYATSTKILSLPQTNNDNQAQKQQQNNKAIQQQFQSKRQKIGQQIQRIERQTRATQQKIYQKKREQQNETKKMKKNIEQLKKKHIQIQSQMNEKKTINQTLKDNIESQEQAVKYGSPQQSQSKIELSSLQQLYCQISKISESQLPKYLTKIPFISDPSHPTIQQWSLIRQKQALQSQIDTYQNSILGHRQVNESTLGKMMREQNAMISQMIKNYIKQRYLWGEVQKFVSTVL